MTEFEKLQLRALAQIVELLTYGTDHDEIIKRSDEIMLDIDDVTIEKKRGLWFF